MLAWLITWEGTHRTITNDSKLIGIIRAQHSTSYMRRLVRFLYLTSISNAADMKKVAYRPKLWPEVRKLGGGLWCGYAQKVIYARIVSDLEVITETIPNKEIVSWREPDIVKQKPPNYRLEATPGEWKTLRRRSNIMLGNGC